MDEQAWRESSALRGFPGLHPDLLAATVHTLLTLVVVLHPVFRDTPIRIIVGLPFILFVPGYVFIAALFPKANRRANETTQGHTSKLGITRIGRISLSFGLSMVIVPTVGVVLNYTPFGLRLIPILASLAAVVLVLVFAAAARRWALPRHERFVVPWRSRLSSIWTRVGSPDSRTDAVLNVLLAMSLIVAAASVGYAVTVPTDGESTTEFYLSSKNGDGELGEEYPTTLAAGESEEFVFEVENSEGELVDYTVLVELQQVRVQNGSSQTLRTERLHTFTQSVDRNQTWQRTHTVTPRLTGDRLRLTYLLYIGDPPASPSTENAYRELHVWITVTDDS